MPRDMREILNDSAKGHRRQQKAQLNEIAKKLGHKPTCDVSDIRDDVMSLIKNSRLTFKQVEGAGGPAAGTLSKWAAKETERPQLNTIRAALRAVGHDLGIIERKQ
jgi:phosphoglycolate phosphatase-like HAD superfamily hydrolase